MDWEGKVVQLHEKLLRRRRKLRLARRLAAKTSRDILTAREATVLIHLSKLPKLFFQSKTEMMGQGISYKCWTNRVTQMKCEMLERQEQR